MAKPKSTSTLVRALQFISKAQTDDRKSEKKVASIQKHCSVANGFITATNTIISCGHPTELDLEASPHTYYFLDALSRCSENYSITQHPGKLTVKSGKFSAQVLTLDDQISAITPDASCAPVSDALKESLGKVMQLATEGASRVIESAVLLSSGSVLATDAKVMIEAWHGVDMPRLTVPKVFASALCSIDKKLISFGFSQSSVTFFFEDGAWIKSQLYAEEFPDCSKILDCTGTPDVMPEGFFEAVRQVEDFAEGKEHEKTVYISEKGMSSHKDQAQGAFFEFEGFPESSFKIKQLKQIEKCCKSYVKSKGKMWFFGEGCRGAVMEAF